MSKPPFDPTKPFAEAKPAFDPNQPFQPVTDTGLPSLDETTDENSTGSSLIDIAAKANPVLDLANNVAKSPNARHAVNDIALQEGGAALGTAVMPGPGTVIGAGLGNATAKVVNDVEDNPELASRAAQYIFSDPQHAQLIKDLTTDNPDQAAQYVRTLGGPLLKRFTTGAIMQLIGMGLGKLAGKVFNGMRGGALDVGSKTLEGVTEDAADLTPKDAFGNPTDSGVNLNPAQMTNSKVADIVDRTARKGILSADTMRAFDESNKVALKRAQSNLSSELAGGLSERIPRTELADYITSSNKLGDKIQKEVQNRLYSEADTALGGDLVPIQEKAPSGILDPKTGKEVMTETGNVIYKRVGGITVPTAQIKDFAQRELTKAELINNVGNAEKLGPLLQKIQGLDKGVNFSDMQNLRSELGDLNREATGGAKKILAEASKIIFNSMEETAKVLEPEGYKAWRTADTFFKEGKDVFQNDAVAKLLTNDYRMADNLGRAMYDTGNIEQIRQLKTIASRVDDLVNNPAYANELKTVMEKNPQLVGILDKGELTKDAIMNRYRKGYLQKMFNGYETPDIKAGNTSTLNFQGLLGELQHPDNIDTMKELFTPDQISKLQKFARVGALAMKNAPEATRESLWVLTKMGWGSKMASTLLSPVAAKILTNPEGQDMLLNGLTKLANGAGRAAVRDGSALILRAGNAILNQNIDNAQEE